MAVPLAGRYPMYYNVKVHKGRLLRAVLKYWNTIGECLQTRVLPRRLSRFNLHSLFYVWEGFVCPKCELWQVDLCNLTCVFKLILMIKTDSVLISFNLLFFSFLLLFLLCSYCTVIYEHFVSRSIWLLFLFFFSWDFFFLSSFFFLHFLSSFPKYFFPSFLSHRLLFPCSCAFRAAPSYGCRPPKLM